MLLIGPSAVWLCRDADKVQAIRPVGGPATSDQLLSLWRRAATDALAVRADASVTDLGGCVALGDPERVW